MQIVLTSDERQTLERWARCRTSSQALALRCRIVLGCAQGHTNVQVGAQLGVHPDTVGKWRGRFARRRLEGLSDEPRPGVPRTITDAQVEQVITKTLEETPTDATHWSIRSMARAVKMSQMAVSRIWRAGLVQQHQAELISRPACGGEEPVGQVVVAPSGQVGAVKHGVDAARGWPGIGVGCG